MAKSTFSFQIFEFHGRFDFSVHTRLVQNRTTGLKRILRVGPCKTVEAARKGKVT